MATCGLDLGYYGNAIWQFGRGHFFAQTVLAQQRFINHCAPLLAVLAPFTYVFREPAYLLVLQSLALAAGIVVTYAAARPDTGSRWPAAALALSFGLAPALHGANFYDFHPRALGVPLTLAAFYFFNRKDFRAGLICAALVAAAQDELALHAVALAAWGGFAAGRRRAGLVAAGVFAAYFFGVCLFLYPRLTYAPAGIPQHFAGYFQPPAAVPLHKERLAQLLFAKSGYVGMLVAPAAAFLPASAGALATLITPLAVPVLATRPTVFQIGWQYPLSTLPFLYGAAALGLRRLVRPDMAKGRRFLIIAACLGAVFFQVILTAHLGKRYYRPTLAPVLRRPHELALLRATRVVPPGVPVCADDPFVAHLAQRRYCYRYEVPFTARVAVPPEALLVDRRRHSPADLPAILEQARAWRLNLAAENADYAYFDRGPPRRPATALFRDWFGSVEPWQCQIPGGRRFARDPSARGGRAALVPSRLRYEPRRGYIYPAGSYALAFRLRPLDDRGFCFAVINAEVVAGGRPAKGARYRLATEVKSGAGYRPYVLRFASDRPFNLYFDLYAAAPLYFDGALIESADYYRFAAESVCREP